MNNLTRILVFLGTVLAAPFALWLAVAAANSREYLALARSGLLLIGLFGMLWGTLQRRLVVAACGIAFVGLGFLTYLGSGPGNDVPVAMEETWWTLKAKLCCPLLGNLHMWHVAVAAFLILNGRLVARAAPARRLAGANIFFLGVVFLAILVGAR